jgi:hypothetical protein
MRHAERHGPLEVALVERARDERAGADAAYKHILGLEAMWCTTRLSARN